MDEDIENVSEIVIVSSDYIVIIIISDNIEHDENKHDSGEGEEKL